MPLVDTSDSSIYHNNHVNEAARLWWNHGLYGGQPRTIPVGEPRIRLGYLRFAQQLRDRNKALAIEAALSALGAQPDHRILVLGAGFGWSANELRGRFASGVVVGTETGAWIQSVKATDETDEINAALDGATRWTQADPNAPANLTPAERATWMGRLNMGARGVGELLDEDAVAGGSRNNIKSALGIARNARCEWVVTEQVLPWLTDAECVDLSARAHDLGLNVVHYLTPYDDRQADPDEPNPWNWKRLQAGDPVSQHLLDQPWYTEDNWKTLLPNDVVMFGRQVVV